MRKILSSPSDFWFRHFYQEIRKFWLTGPILTLFMQGRAWLGLEWIFSHMSTHIWTFQTDEKPYHSSCPIGSALSFILANLWLVLYSVRGDEAKLEHFLNKLIKNINKYGLIIIVSLTRLERFWAIIIPKIWRGIPSVCACQSQMFIKTTAQLNVFMFRKYFRPKMFLNIWHFLLNIL